MKAGMSFREWAITYNDDDYDMDRITELFVETITKYDSHMGDCCRVPCTCSLCWLGDMLNEYLKYCEENKMVS
jgi:hypothetical protein